MTKREANEELTKAEQDLTASYCPMTKTFCNPCCICRTVGKVIYYSNTGLHSIVYPACTNPTLIGD